MKIQQTKFKIELIDWNAIQGGAVKKIWNTLNF